MPNKENKDVLTGIMDQKQTWTTDDRLCSAKQSETVSEHDNSERLQMTETRIYVGLNDADTKEQKHETERFVNILKNVCRNYHVAFSMDIEDGGYFHENGEYTEETSLVLTLVNSDRNTVEEIARDLCTFFHQESVLVTVNHIEGYFISQSF